MSDYALHIATISDYGEILHGTDFRSSQFIKKKELIDAAKHFDLEMNECISKAELKKLVLDYLEELMAEPEFINELRGE